MLFLEPPRDAYSSMPDIHADIIIMKDNFHPRVGNLFQKAIKECDFSHYENKQEPSFIFNDLSTDPVCRFNFLRVFVNLILGKLLVYRLFLNFHFGYFSFFPS